MVCPGFIFNRWAHFLLILKTALPLFSNAQNGISHALISPKHADSSALARGSVVTAPEAGWRTRHGLLLEGPAWRPRCVPKRV